MTKALEGSARYGARSFPNCFSVLAEVLPTMMGTSLGNADSEGKDLDLASMTLLLCETENRGRDSSHLDSIL